ncbi:ABC transporter ATP-binding protein [Marinococcus sp. PL1-022]|uniref:ABC transporter ATP-binding protein n=1 Tax=Marinococcus sp. PL1-022 TaxID=3095363 RepID=UPI0029C1659E|nr:ABC transporter ATP-binding protein [Marinococcus sp. PL1-022]MDX6154537.1 ABC transporter ATP-binding protein [Marinococcus sp. PL1-022]
MIHVQHLTRLFPNGKGIQDVSFEVSEGEVFGFLGPNGAGKSTTIRHLLGYMKPQKGHASIAGYDTWREQQEARDRIGYLPGEMAFLENMTGRQFLDLMARMQGNQNSQRQRELMDRLQLDPKVPIRKMSKGMKQKVGIVATFMHDPSVYILDEPTSGLDPLMQQTFIALVLEEKARGKTFLMSSHSFPEIERTSDRAAIIKDGRIIDIRNVHDLQAMQRKQFDLTLKNKDDLARIYHKDLTVVDQLSELVVRVEVQNDYQKFFRRLSDVDMANIAVSEQNLEDIFLDYYQHSPKETPL